MYTYEVWAFFKNADIMVMRNVGIVQIRVDKEVKIREQDTFYRDELNFCAK